MIFSVYPFVTGVLGARSLESLEWRNRTECDYYGAYMGRLLDADVPIDASRIQHISSTYHLNIPEHTRTIYG